jgi:hypothetical protein
LDSPPLQRCRALIREDRGGDRGGSTGLLRRSGLGLGVALALLPTGLSGSAFAAVAGHEIVGAASVIDSVHSKTVTVTCPSGKQVVGVAGSKSLAAGGQALVSRIRPDSGLKSATVSGREDGSGFTGNWGVTAQAFCATPLPGLERVVATSTTSSSNKTITAVCPAGKKLLGAGGEITNGSGQVVLDDLRPRSDLTGVLATGLEDGDGYAANWSVTAFAVCATPPAGLQRVAATSASTSNDKSVQPNCTGGKRPLGVGGEVNSGAGQVSMDLSPFRVVDDFVGANARAFEDDTGFTGSWSVTAYAICANVSSRFVATTASDSIDKSATQLCPTAGEDAHPGSEPLGRQATGGGGDVVGSLGQVVMTSMSTGLRRVTTDGFEDANGFVGNWRVRAYAICATPLPGLEAVSDVNVSPSPGVFPQDPFASCPAGKKLVGAGGGIHGVGGQIPLQSIGVPFSDSGARVEQASPIFDELFSRDSVWSVEAVAMCATPPRGLQLVFATSLPDSDPASVTASCPPGKNLLGGGGQTSTPSGVLIDDIRPDDLLTGITVTGLENEKGTESDWTVTAYAICANA